MNARTGELALDVAFEKFDGPPPVALVISYNGPALPTHEEAAAWKRPLLLGFESSTTRSYAGGDAGEADAAFSCGVFDEWGYPRECGSWFCAADDPDTPAQFLPNVSEYGRRYALRMIAGGRSGPLTPYGNRDAVEAGASGIRAAGLIARRWGVGTWTGYGESGDGRPPPLADAELLQSGNNQGPRPATDLDWLYAPVSAFAPMGGPAPPAPVPTSGGDMDMYVGQLDHDGASGNVPLPARTQLALLVSPRGRIISTWAGDPDAVGIPKAAAAWAAARPKVNTIPLDPPQMAEIVADDHALRTTPTGGGGGPLKVSLAGTAVPG